MKILHVLKKPLSVVALFSLLAQMLFLGAVPAMAGVGAWSVDASRLDDTQCISTFQCKTIQAAVTAAASGDTINVAAGIYAEKILISGKSNLTLQGVGDGSLIEPAYDDSGTAGITIINSNGLTIKDLKIHTAGREMEGIWIYGFAFGGNAITGLTIQHTTIIV